ncbi:MAG TPA: POTRA domain-containing protein [Terracidiphilus sp.]|jgi:outer membrane translocation and assembly module TamA
MSRFTSVLILFATVCFAYAQEPQQPLDSPVEVKSLTILSTTLPEADRQRIIQAYSGKSYAPEELRERVLQNLRDTGYYAARADDAQLSNDRGGVASRSAHISIRVEPGARYRYGAIMFRGATVFAPEELRRQFAWKSGELYNATAIGKGLEKVRDLYLEKGYINLGVIPKPRLDEARHVVDMDLDIDEGRQASFGFLKLDGLEPVAGAGKALIASWKELEGKVYNPQSLKDWLARNSSGWPSDAAARVHTEYIAGSNRDVAVAVLLHFQ